MGSNQLVAFAIAAIFVLPTIAMAAEYVVGDNNGWKTDVNYTEWASGKVFYVGDKLVFTYGPPHNVYKVDGAGFKDCKPSGDLYSTGNDTFTLMKPGKKWYICGYNDHCQKGQKLVINVESNGPVPAPTPAPTPAATATPTPTPAPASNDSYRSFVLSWYQIFLAAIATMVVAAF